MLIVILVILLLLSKSESTECSLQIGQGCMSRSGRGPALGLRHSFALGVSRVWLGVPDMKAVGLPSGTFRCDSHSESVGWATVGFHKERRDPQEWWSVQQLSRLR